MNELNTQIELIVSEIIKGVRRAKTLEDLTIANTKGVEDITELVKKLTIPVVVSSSDFKKPTFQEMRKKVMDSKQFTKRDGLWHHRQFGWKNLREAYKIVTS